MGWLAEAEAVLLREETPPLPDLAPMKLSKEFPQLALFLLLDDSLGSPPWSSQRMRKRPSFVPLRNW